MVFVNTSKDLSLIKWKRIVAISEEGTKFQINLRTYLMQAAKSGPSIFPKLTLKSNTSKLWKKCNLEETTNKTNIFYWNTQ